MECKVNCEGDGGCALLLNVDVIGLIDRETFSRGEGEEHGLNVNYPMFETIAIAANIIGRENGFKYGKHFICRGSGKLGLGEIYFDFRSKEEKDAAERTLEAIISLR